MARRESVPSSGSAASRVVARTSPTPGTPCNKASRTRHIGCAWMSRRSSVSRVSSRRCSHRRWAWSSGRRARGAPASRFCSAVSISTSCRRRVTNASAPGARHRGRGGGPAGPPPRSGRAPRHPRGRSSPGSRWPSRSPAPGGGSPPRRRARRSRGRWPRAVRGPRSPRGGPGRAAGPEPRGQGMPGRVGLGHGPAGAPAADGDHELVLGDIDPDEGGRLSHGVLLHARSCAMRAHAGPGDCPG